MKPLPKSLHTVTVLVRIARMFMLRMPVNQAMMAALDTLGYTKDMDVYDLTSAALKQLTKG